MSEESFISWRKGNASISAELVCQICRKTTRSMTLVTITDYSPMDLRICLLEEILKDLQYFFVCDSCFSHAVRCTLALGNLYINRNNSIALVDVGCFICGVDNYLIDFNLKRDLVSMMVVQSISRQFDFKTEYSKKICENCDSLFTHLAALYKIIRNNPKYPGDEIATKPPPGFVPNEKQRIYVETSPSEGGTNFSLMNKGEAKTFFTITQGNSSLPDTEFLERPSELQYTEGEDKIRKVFPVKEPHFDWHDIPEGLQEISRALLLLESEDARHKEQILHEPTSAEDSKFHDVLETTRQQKFEEKHTRMPLQEKVCPGVSGLHTETVEDVSGDAQSGIDPESAAVLKRLSPQIKRVSQFLMRKIDMSREAKVEIQPSGITYLEEENRQPLDEDSVTRSASTSEMNENTMQAMDLLEMVLNFQSEVANKPVSKADTQNFRENVVGFLKGVADNSLLDESLAQRINDTIQELETKKSTPSLDTIEITSEEALISDTSVATPTHAVSLPKVANTRGSSKQSNQSPKMSHTQYYAEGNPQTIKEVLASVRKGAGDKKLPASAPPKQQKPLPKSPVMKKAPASTPKIPLKVQLRPESSTYLDTKTQPKSATNAGKKVAPTTKLHGSSSEQVEELHVNKAFSNRRSAPKRVSEAKSTPIIPGKQHVLSDSKAKVEMRRSSQTDSPSGEIKKYTGTVPKTIVAKVDSRRPTGQKTARSGRGEEDPPLSRSGTSSREGPHYGFGKHYETLPKLKYTEEFGDRKKKYFNKSVPNIQEIRKQDIETILTQGKSKSTTDTKTRGAVKKVYEIPKSVDSSSSPSEGDPNVANVSWSEDDRYFMEELESIRPKGKLSVTELYKKYEMEDAEDENRAMTWKTSSEDAVMYEEQSPSEYKEESDKSEYVEEEHSPTYSQEGEAYEEEEEPQLVSSTPIRGKKIIGSMTARPESKFRSEKPGRVIPSMDVGVSESKLRDSFSRLSMANARKITPKKVLLPKLEESERELRARANVGLYLLRKESIERIYGSSPKPKPKPKVQVKQEEESKIPLKKFPASTSKIDSAAKASKPGQSKTTKPTRSSAPSLKVPRGTNK